MRPITFTSKIITRPKLSEEELALFRLAIQEKWEEPTTTLSTGNGVEINDQYGNVTLYYGYSTRQSIEDNADNALIQLGQTIQVLIESLG